MKTLERNKNGIATIQTENGIAQAKIPSGHTALGLVAMNGIIHGGDYNENGWVYINGKQHRKWHITVENTRIWKPKMRDLVYLYNVYKKTQDYNKILWERISKIMQNMWKTCSHNEKNKVILHAVPTHSFENNIDSNAWCEYTIGQSRYPGAKEDQLAFSFDWVDGKPEKIMHPEEGQKFYELERYIYGTCCNRSGKARNVFFEAMKRTLPIPDAYKIITFEFKEDKFVFHTQFKRHTVEWEMFDERCEFEVRTIV